MPVEMDLSLDIAPAAPRPPLEVSYVRDLNEADIGLADSPPAAPAENRVAKLREVHHALARCLAAGMKEGEAALACGYTLSRVSILKTAPAFQELVAFYRQNLDVVYADLHARMSSFSVDVLEELRSRFEDSPEAMSNVFLADLVKTLADRTGFGPKTTQANINLVRLS